MRRWGSGSRSWCTAEINTYFRRYLSNILDGTRPLLAGSPARPQRSIIVQ